MEEGRLVIRYDYYLQLADDIERQVQGEASGSMSPAEEAECFFFVLSMAQSLSLLPWYMMRVLDFDGPLSLKLAQHCEKMSLLVQACSDECASGEASIRSLAAQMRPPPCIIGCIRKTITGIRDFQKGIPARVPLCSSPRLYAMYIVERFIIKGLFFSSPTALLNPHLKAFKEELHAVALSYLIEKSTGS